MFRLWAKAFQNTHMLWDLVVEDATEDTRTHKIFHAIDRVCKEKDLPHPIWLDSNISDFKRISATRFTRDSFVEEIPFDHLEIRVIEEDV
ncbi:MAG: hypothetical protein K5891_02780 [Lachnospiraceae bacterium]|nr:hypothetical protein [Lachnospiraceae bacterium]